MQKWSGLWLIIFTVIAATGYPGRTKAGELTLFATQVSSLLSLFSSQRSQFSALFVVHPSLMRSSSWGSCSLRVGLYALFSLHMWANLEAPLVSSSFMICQNCPPLCFSAQLRNCALILAIDLSCALYNLKSYLLATACLPDHAFGAHAARSERWTLRPCFIIIIPNNICFLIESKG